VEPKIKTPSFTHTERGSTGLTALLESTSWVQKDELGAQLSFIDEEMEGQLEWRTP
jgi:hypothetical protein